jgi:hypothetical protein
MEFDYRVIELKNGEFIIGEIYYEDDTNDIIYWCDTPAECYGETLELLKEEMEYIMEAFKKPMLKENEDGQLVCMDQ